MTPRPLKRVIEFGRVGAEKESYVCPVCLGPVNPGYIRCFACDVLFNNIAESCQPTVVPISAALYRVNMNLSFDPAFWPR